MVKIILSLIFFSLFFVSTLFAQPQIAQIEKNANTINITGTEFGTNLLDIEWLGENIETSNSGEIISKPDWSTVSDSASWYAARYDDSEKHSGNKSLLTKWGGDPYRYGSTFRYNASSSISKIYLTWWIKFDYSGEPGQWKIWRLRCNESVYDVSPEFYQNRWYSNGMIQAFLRPSSTDSQWYHTGGNINGCLWLSEDDAPKKNEWVRMEYYFEASAQGVKDGTIKYFLHRPGVEIRNPINHDGNLMTYGPDQEKRWQYLIFGQYWGNGPVTGDSASAWYDDIFIQLGSPARVEIGDASTWANCTHREIQIPTAWASDGTSITATVNQGSFNTGDSVYLFVVDANGTPSNGYGPITIGSNDFDSPSDSQPPITTDHNPAKNATEIPADTNIVVHVQDTGDGVDQSTIIMQVNGQVITPVISGNLNDYILTYDPPADFNSQETVNITINAGDLHDPSNVMQADNYTFTIASAEDVISKTFGETSAADYKGLVQDTFININNINPDIDVASKTLNTYTWQANQSANAIIMKWDFSILPENAVIDSATLHLYMNETGGDDLYDISVHNIINYNPNLSECTGYTYDGTNSWTANSLCYNNIPLAQSDIDTFEDTKQVNTTIGYKTWSVTNMVRSWIDNPTANYGLLVNSDSSASSGSHRYFASSEATNENQRPMLVVTYTIDSSIDTTPPVNVSSFSATAGDAQNTLAWTNPAEDFTGTTIRYRTDTFPADPTDGLELYEGTDSTFVHSDLLNNITYYYTAFAHDAALNYSSGVQASAAQANQPPVASATLDQTAGESPLEVFFDGSASQDPDGTIASYAWNFGDGNTSTEKSPVHIYERVSSDTTYNISLTVTDNNDTSSEPITLSITILPDTFPPNTVQGVDAE